MYEIENGGIKVWKILLYVVLIIVTVLIYTFINKSEKQEKKSFNKNYPNEIVNGLKFDRIKIYEKKNNYYFTARVVNISDSSIEIEKVKVKLDDYSFNSYVGKSLKKNDYSMIFMETKNNLSDNKKVSFSIDN